MMIDGTVTIASSVYTIDGKYTKAAANDTTQYKVRLQKQEPIALGELLQDYGLDFGLDDSPFSVDLSALPSAAPYIEVSNKTTRAKPKPKSKRRKRSKSTAKQQGS